MDLRPEASEAEPSAPAGRTGLAPDEAQTARTLVVLVPCLNEEQTVARVVAAVPRDLPHFARTLVVVVDDGSTDRTAERALRAGARVLDLGGHLGLGRAFAAGVREALALGADVVVNIDGDGQFDPADLPALIDPVLRGEAHMATASRFADPRLAPPMPWVKRWGNRRVARIVRLLTGHRFHDVSCGFRAFSREALLRMNLFGSFTYTQETFLDLVFKGMRIVEVPIRVRGSREFGRSRMAASIPRYAWRSMAIMMRAFLGYRPFAFFTTLSCAFIAPALLLLAFLLSHYLRTGAFSPHIWAGFVGGSLAFVGIQTWVIGFLGDMLVRMRSNQEEILYRLKRTAYDTSAAPHRHSQPPART